MPNFAPSVIEVVLHAQQEGSERLHVMHTRAAGSVPTPAELQATVDAYIAAVLNSLGVWSDTVEFFTVKATDRSVINGPSYEAPFPAGTVGASSYQPLPGNVSLAVTLLTIFGGRSHKGRAYMFGLTANHLQGPSRVSIGYISLVTIFIGNLIGELQSAGVPLGIFSRVLGTISLVSAFSVNRDVDSQRRRLIGRGR
jgi:hypothetical protein